MASEYKWQYYGSLIDCDTRDSVRDKLQSWIDMGHVESDTYVHCLGCLDEPMVNKDLRASDMPK